MRQQVAGQRSQSTISNGFWLYNAVLAAREKLVSLRLYRQYRQITLSIALSPVNERDFDRTYT